MSIPRDANDPGYPVHPGVMLFEEFMKPLGLSSAALGESLHVPEARIAELIEGKNVIDADLAYRLQIYFGMTVGFWMNLQKDYELGKLRYSAAYDKLVSEVKPRLKETSLAGAA